MNRFQKRGLALGLSLSLLASLPVLAYADGVDMTPAEIVAEYNRLMDLEAGDSLDAFVHSLSEEQRKTLLSDVIRDVIEESAEEKPAEAESSMSWTLDENGLLTITGTGKMPDFSKPESAPWQDQREKITAVAVELGITGIGNFAFADCPNLTECSLPGSVTEIGMDAFRNCTSLKKLPLPEELKTIGDNAFSGCSSIRTVKVPEGVTGIGAGAFENCTELRSVTLPGTLETLGASAFAGCSALGSGYLPQNLKELGEGAFRNCTSLKSITVPNGVTEIAKETFRGCTALASVTLYQSVQSIGDEAFLGCTSLRKMFFPENLVSIGDRAFGGCVSLSKITLPDAVTEVGEEAFSGCETLESVKFNENLTKIGENCFAGCPLLENLALPGAGKPVETALTGEEAESSEPAGETEEETETKPMEESEEVSETTEEEPAEEETPKAEPSICIENATASAGNTVTLAVSLQDNPGIVSLSLNVKYDAQVMKLVKAEDTGLLSGGEHKLELSSPYRLNWANDTLTTDITENGCIAMLTFEISEDAQKGAYPIRLEFHPENGDVYNSTLNAVVFQVCDGGIAVVNAVLGDVNGDGVINGLDRAALNRYLTMGREAAQDIDLSAADVNGDGKVNNVDRAILSRYLAGWTGYETLPVAAEE